MGQARGKQGNLGNVVAEMDFKPHAEFLGKRLETLHDLIAGNLESFATPLEPRQEDASFEVGVLVREQDVAAMVEDEAGDACNQTFPVKAGDEQRRGVRHGDGGGADVECEGES